MGTKIDNEFIQAHMRNRINWGAILGGTVIGLFSQILLGILGIAIGLLVINPQEIIGTGFTFGTVLYLVIITLFSVFIAAFTTGRFAGLLSKNDSILHGIATLALLTIISLFTLTGNVPGVLNYGLHTAYLPRVQQVLPAKYDNNGNRTGAAAFMTPQQQRQLQQQANNNITGLSWTEFIAGILALVAAAFGGIMGMKSRVHYHGHV